jgi:hypothetical protein
VLQALEAAGKPSERTRQRDTSAREAFKLASSLISLI